MLPIDHRCRSKVHVAMFLSAVIRHYYYHKTASSPALIAFQFKILATMDGRKTCCEVVAAVYMSRYQ